jgi:hypothetical protein
MAQIGASLLVCLVMLASETAPPKPEPVTLTGKVVELTDALTTLGVPADADPVARQVVLVQDDGTITPLLSDPASRALFQDERLRRRRAKLQGLRFAGLPYLQVVLFQVEEDNAFVTPEYYCDVCTISVRYPQPCPCCQGPMELRMRAD